jgi:drug/metabolite transporter (DMT)-like permease
VDPIAIGLILVSACLHAGWNLLSKNAYPTAAFYLMANAFGCLLLCPVLPLYHSALPVLPVDVWIFLFSAGFFQAVYCTSLASAYRAGDLSIAYPLVRSSPVIVVTIAMFLLGRGDQISGLSIAGITLIVAGGFLLPMRHIDDIRLKNYLNKSSTAALIAACATAGYSIIDDQALRLLQASEGLPGTIQTTLLYALLGGLSSVLWLGFFTLVNQRERARLRTALKEQLRVSALVGAGMYVTYPLVLISMAFVANVSYVVAFRQISLPIGVVFGVWIFKEPGYALKFIGITIIFLGLVLVASG